MRAICILFACAIAVGAVTLTEEQAPQGVLNPTAGPRLITAIIDCTPEKRTAVSTWLCTSRPSIFELMPGAV